MPGEEEEIKKLLEQLGPGDSPTPEQMKELFPNIEEQVNKEFEEEQQRKAAEIYAAQAAAEEERKRKLIAMQRHLEEIGPYEREKLRKATMRAVRGNMKRRLLKRFAFYESFTILQAAQRCDVHIELMRGYLESEVFIPGANVIFIGEGKYCIRNPYDE